MISKEILGFLCIKMVFQLETPTLISTVRWSDTKAHSETLLFSDSKTKSDLLFFPDRHLSQSGLNREGAWSYCSELYLPLFFFLKTLPFLHSMVQLWESPLQRDDIQMWNQRREKLLFLTQHYSSCCRWIYWNKKHDFVFTFNHFICENYIIVRVKSLYFNWVWPPAGSVWCLSPPLQDLNCAFQHQSESVAYQPVRVVWI